MTTKEGSNSPNNDPWSEGNSDIFYYEHDQQKDSHTNQRNHGFGGYEVD